MDPGLHRLQGETERVKPSDLLDLMRQFYAEKLGLKLRHEAGARLVATYDFNNTYQYVIAREEAHLDWLQRAIARYATGEAAAAGNGAAPTPSVPTDERGIITDDARLEQAFLDKWRERVEQVSDSREKLMLRVILGETLEHKRFFEQALAGRTDLLGRRTSPSKASGSVLTTRWRE